jgi:hypothetical protein
MDTDRALERAGASSAQAERDPVSALLDEHGTAASGQSAELNGAGAVRARAGEAPVKDQHAKAVAGVAASWRRHRRGGGARDAFVNQARGDVEGVAKGDRARLKGNTGAGRGAARRLRAEQGQNAPPSPPGPDAPAGRFNVTIGGQAIGDFASLDEVEAALEERRADLDALGAQGDVTVGITLTPAGAVVREAAETVWHFYHPRARVHIDGQGGQVSGDATGAEDAAPAPGYFLAYRPVVGAGHGAEAPAPANIELRNLSISGYQSGGLEISPQASGEIPADHLPGGSPQARDRSFGRDHGGNVAFVSGAVVQGVDFRNLGNAHTPDAERVYDARGQHAGSEGHNGFGAGAVMMRGVQDSRIVDNRFSGLVNGVHRNLDAGGAREDGKHLLHGVYLNNRSSGNEVARNSFEGVSGDAIRVSHGSNDNRVLRNVARNSGARGLVSNWHDASKGQADSTGTLVRNNKVGDLYGSKVQGGAYHRQVKGS